MHSRDPYKDGSAFWSEIDAILKQTSPYVRLRDRLDFTQFAFPGAEFSEARFVHNADFSKAIFLQNASFFGATFAESANFSLVTFAQEANFFGATFNKDATFNGARFTQKALFNGATFAQSALFNSVKFGQDVLFYKATFTQHANFLRATFARDANFVEATFTEDAIFGEATFTEDAAFGGTTFIRGANFTEATFTEALDLSYASFGPRETPGTSTTSEMSPAVADFGGSRFEKPGNVLFFQVNQPMPEPHSESAPRPGRPLQALRVRFLLCDTEHVRFSDVSWHRTRGRLTLQDEIDVREHKHRDYALVGEAYRQLVNNFQRVRAYELAEDCVIGAMEMRRLDPGRSKLGWLGRWISVINLYRLLSNYGSSYMRALGVFLGLLLACALFFPAFGLRLAKEAGSAPPAGEADTTSWSGAWRSANRTTELYRTLKTGLLESLDVATFQKDRPYEPANGYGHVLADLETAAVPAQLALLLLALRRRFRL